MPKKKTRGEIGELDYSQLHLRIMGNLAQCEGFIDAYEKGIDMHSRTAAETIMMIPEVKFLAEYAKGVEKYETARDHGKRTNFSIIFEIGASALAVKTGLEKSVCKKIIERWLDHFWEVRDQIERQHKYAEKYGYVISPFGRVRHLPAVWANDDHIKSRALRQAGDYLISNSGRYITMYSMIMLEEAMEQEKMESLIISQVHDSIVFDIFPGERDHLFELAYKYMIKEISEITASWMDPIPLVIDGFTGPNWYKKDATTKVTMSLKDGIQTKKAA